MPPSVCEEKVVCRNDRLRNSYLLLTVQLAAELQHAICHIQAKYAVASADAQYPVCYERFYPKSFSGLCRFDAWPLVVPLQRAAFDVQAVYIPFLRYHEEVAFVQQHLRADIAFDLELPLYAAALRVHRVDQLPFRHIERALR
jgi:hypothetical protein